MLAHRPRLRKGAETAGGQLEIFAAEEVSVGAEEGDEVHPRHEDEDQRHEVHEQGEAGEAES